MGPIIGGLERSRPLSGQWNRGTKMWFIVLVLLGVFVLICVFGAKANKKETEEAEIADDLARNGDSEAQCSRGDYYIDKNLEEAKYWYSKAAEQGSSKVQARLDIIDLVK